MLMFRQILRLFRINCQTRVLRHNLGAFLPTSIIALSVEFNIPPLYTRRNSGVATGVLWFNTPQ